jgi:hypothetical protein
MARTISQAIWLPAQTPNWVQQYLFLMSDNTIWILNGETLAWAKAPPVPGSRIVTCILTPPNSVAPFVTVGYAACSDFTIWSCPITNPVWTQIATTIPQT